MWPGRTWVGVDAGQLGSWSRDLVRLVHLFPEADVPVVQLSINGFKPLEYHLALGAKLAPLREEGIFILGSGNVVHNLGAIDVRLGETGFVWAERFDEAAREAMTDSPGDVLDVQGGRTSIWRCQPGPLHPAALRRRPRRRRRGRCEVLVDGYMGGSLTMTSYVLGQPVPAAAAASTPRSTSCSSRTTSLRATPTCSYRRRRRRP